MSRPRILFMLSRFLDGGIDTILLEYLRALDPERCDVTLAIAVKMDELEVHRGEIPPWVKVAYLVDSPMLTRVRKAKIKRKVNALAKVLDETLLNIVRKVVSRRRLKRLLREADAVVDFDATAYTLLGKAAATKPVVGFYHFSIAENLRRSPRHTNRQMRGMRRYRNIVLLSDAMLREGLELFPELKGKYVRIYNGYDPRRLAAEAARQQSESPQLPSAEPYFLAVNRLEESQKDVTTLLRAYALLLERNTLAPKLVIVGEGRDRERLEQLAGALGLGDRVEFLGFRPDPLGWMKGAEALILSSHYEGFGLVLVEAMTLGRPVIATDCPTGPAEVLDGGRAGILVNPSDPEDLAEALETIVEDPDEARRLAQCALRRSATFDISRSAESLLQLLNPAQ